MKILDSERNPCDKRKRRCCISFYQITDAGESFIPQSLREDWGKIYPRDS